MAHETQQHKADSKNRTTRKKGFKAAAMNENPQPNIVHPSPTPKPTGTSWSKKIVILLLVLVLLVAAWLYLANRKTTAPTTTSTNTVTTPTLATVTISDSGFTPSYITVKPGTQVTWNNSDSKPHQVAADPYPKNDSITGFDSTKVLNPGDSYSFIFQSKGVYHYHDQLNPYKLLGTVEVK